MNRMLFGGLSALLFPFAAHAAATSAGGYLMRGGYQPRSHARLQADALGSMARVPQRAKPWAWHATDPVDVASLDILQQPLATELVVIDGSITDKAALYRGLKPGVVAVEIDPSRPGLPQLADALRGHRNLAAIHVVSHASAGVLLLGSSRITAENAHQKLAALSALRQAVRPNADLLFYGCDLAANAEGGALLDIVQQETGLDVAASSNLTGSTALGGDWDLEVVRGNVETSVAFSDKALQDFSQVLVASSGTKTFQMGWVDNNANLTSTDFIVTAKDNGGSAISNISIYTSPPFAAYLQTGYNTSTTGTYFQVAADGTNTGSFELTGLEAGEYGAGQFTNVRIVGIRPDNSTVTSGIINGTGATSETFTFGAGQLASFAGVKLKAFKLVFDTSSGPGTKPFFEFRNFTITGALAPLPVVTDSRISISGATGIGGAYKIGDTVTATWNNTAGGDNNAGITGVAMDFSQFGGGSAVAASNSGNNWTATYTITSGAIDTANRNVSVTATNANGPATTTDTSNATVDNVAPTVTDGRISISGATGTSGAYKIGDTVTATWNNTAGGDNNADTISGVTVNFTDFGGGTAVAATNSSGTWTATYTIVSGAVDATNRNVSVTATDNAGNATTTTDTINATLDNNPPSVSSIAVSGSPASTDTSMAFTVTFDEPVVNVSTDDFTLAGTGSATGTIASVSASSGSSINVNIAGISGNGTIKVNLNGSTNIIDDAGNSIPSYNSGSAHTVAVPIAPGAPTIGMATAGDAQAVVTFTAPGSNGGSAITTYTATASPGGATGTCAGPAACVIEVGSLTNGTAYTFSVTATNAIGTGSASGASNPVTPMANQIITFAQPSNYNFGATPTLTASSAYAVGGGATGFAINFTSSTTGVCTITSGGVLTFVSAGTCTIDADQAGNASTNAATTVTRSFTVNAIVPSAPTIGTATADDQQATVTFTAPASTGGAAISPNGYTVTANPGGLSEVGSSSPITVTGLTNGVSYTFTVTATNSAGTGAASANSNAVTPKATQTITFANPGSQNFGTSPDLRIVNGGASSTSGLAVTFTSGTTGVCTVTTQGVLTFVTVGTCTINADQAGDNSYLPAIQVTRSFIVDSVAADAPTSVVATAGDAQASVAFVAPAQTGGTTITGYTVTVSPADVVPVNGAGSPIAITGLTNGVSYTFTVRADNSAGTGPESSPSNSVTPKASQTITFTNPGAQNFGTTPTLSATSDSGLTPTFTSSTTGVCTITTGGALTFVTTGTCTINADQAGNGIYLSAPQVTQAFTVNAVVPGAPTINSVSVGSTQATITFTAPASNGGGAITSYTATSNPDGITGTCSASPCTITGLTNGVAYTFTMTATNSAGDGAPSNTSSAVTPQASPVVTNVSVPVNGRYTPTQNLDFTVNWDQPVMVNASGGTPQLALTIGSVIVQAQYLAGSGSNVLVFRHTVLAGSVDNDGITVGTVSLNGGMIDNVNGTPADLALNNVGTTTGVLIGLNTQAITDFASNPAAPTFAANGTFSVSATGGASSNPVVFASNSPSVCTVSGSVVAMLASGTCALTANQAADANYDAAPEVALAVVIGQATPVISWTGELSKIVGDAAFDLPAPTSSSPGAFTYASSDPTVATVSGRTVTIVGAGTATLTATQAATANYMAASISTTLTVEARPDPTREASVVDGVQAQVDASVRFTQVQQGNVRDRLRLLRTAPGTPTQYGMALAYVGRHGGGMSLPLGTGATDRSASTRDYGIWTAGSIVLGERDAHGNGNGFDLRSDGISMGVDRTFGNLVLGAAVGAGWGDTDFADERSSQDATQRSMMAYGLWRGAGNWHVDGVLGWGRLDFDLTRWSTAANALATGTREGDQQFGSLSAGYTHQGVRVDITGYGRLEASRTTLDAYSESGLGTYDLVYREQQVETSAIAAGIEGSHALRWDGRSLRPFWSFEYRSALRNEGDAAMNYVVMPVASDYVLRLRTQADGMWSMGAGFDLSLPRGWQMSFSYRREQGGGLASNGFGLRFTYGGLMPMTPALTSMTPDTPVSGERSTEAGRLGRPARARAEKGP